MSLILANIGIFLLWLRIIAMILPIFKRKKSIIITSIIGAVIGASALRIAPHLIDGAFTSSARRAQ
ncbi:MAG: hypothetical protein H6766_04780 [Candidatus Peribacteria bacterium]|nr:MAG: hypothetical protein H6766_04780 [Candidatus Peribacteria bacterium]